MSWKWPETEYNSYFPWYVILWHAFWYLPLQSVRIIWVALAGIYNFSLRTAAKAWEDSA